VGSNHTFNALQCHLDVIVLDVPWGA